VLGGLFGGVVECLSMIMGLRFLFVLVTAVYALSLLTLRSRKGAEASGAGAAHAEEPSAASSPALAAVRS
jgi:Na+-transporting methylmalonyl-CoA/oxaloacetate decarboxylase gamma subunit